MTQEKTLKKVIKFFFVWSEDKEAEWLSTMSKQGWHLIRVSFLNYTFEKGEPRDYVYQFDFSINSKGKEEEYLELYQSSGWELIDRMGSWYFFRKPAEEDGPHEIYTDSESLKQKYRRILMILCLTGFPLIYNLLIFSKTARGTFYQYVMVFNILLFILWVYAFVRIIFYMKKK